MSKKLPGHGT